MSFFPGEKLVFNDGDVSVPTSLSINGRIFVSLRDHLDAMVGYDMPLPRELVSSIILMNDDHMDGCFLL